MNQHEPVRLFTLKSIFILAVVSTLSLYMLFPSKTALLKLVEESSTAAVSLAFLKELYEGDEDNSEIVIEMAKNYVAKGDYASAIEKLEKLLATEAHQNNSTIVHLYISTLIQQNNQSDGLFKQQIIEKLEGLAALENAAFTAESSSFLAKTAIEFERPDIALKYLSPHAGVAKVASYKQLISLALQSENIDDAIVYSNALFTKEQTLENSKQLLDLMLSANVKAQMSEFLSAYKGELSKRPEFLQTAIEYAKKVGSLTTAHLLVDRLISVDPSATTYTYASELAVTRGDLKSAAKYLESALELAPTAKGYIKLNQIYRWLGNILLAQKSSIKSIELDPSEKSIRSGIDESKALGDLGNQGMLYTKLSEHDFVRKQEYDEWVDAIEKGIGFASASKNLSTLIKKRPNDTALMSHSARLLSYSNSHQVVVDTLHKLSQIRSLTYEETQRSAHAYVMLDKPKLALSVMKNGPNWEAASQQYIEMLASLAYNTSDRELAIKTQLHLKTLGSDAFSTYQYVRLLSPMNAENAKKLLPIYYESQDSALLLSLLSYAFETKDMTLFNQLITPTLSQREFVSMPNILIWQAKYYELNNDNHAARKIYLKVLALEPNNDLALNNLIWFALNKNETSFLENIYHRIKDKSASRSNLWLAMASVSDYLGLNVDAIAWYKKLILADNTAFKGSSGDTIASITKQKTSPAVLLNYANLLERSGNHKHAFAIRKYLLAHKSAQIVALPQGDISHRSLVSILISPSIAKQMVTQSAIKRPNQSTMVELYTQNLSDNQAHKILFWQQQQAFSQFKLPDWQQLSMAILAKDTVKMNKLLDESSKLSVPDSYIAYQKVGRQQEAWNLGESQLGKMNNSAEQQTLRKLHALQHPIKTHSVSAKQSRISAWDVNRLSLEYLAPHQFGNWRLNSYSQQISLANTFLQALDSNETGLGASYYRELKASSWQLKFDLADGIGSSRIGVLGEYARDINDYVAANVHAGLNMPNQFSRLMYIAGKENTLGFGLSYRPTARESIIFNGSLKDLSTRFGEDIGTGWGFNLRFTEQFLFNDPAFQVYADINIQRFSLKEDSFDEFNRHLSVGKQVNVRDFAQEDFQRVGIGQRIENGLAGVAGKTKPSPTYWLDTSLGYNNVSEEIDLTVSAGLGWRILGDDELYFKVDWQSADRNGNEYSLLSLGYIYGL